MRYGPGDYRNGPLTHSSDGIPVHFPGPPRALCPQQPGVNGEGMREGGNPHVYGTVEIVHETTDPRVERPLTSSRCPVTGQDPRFEEQVPEGHLGESDTHDILRPPTLANRHEPRKPHIAFSPMTSPLARVQTSLVPSLSTLMRQNLLKARVRRGWSQEQMAEFMEMDQSTLSQKETGVRGWAAILFLENALLRAGIDPMELIQTSASEELDAETMEMARLLAKADETLRSVVKLLLHREVQEQKDLPVIRRAGPG